MDTHIQNNFCILPFIHLEVSTDASIRPCCLFKKQLMDENGVNKYLYDYDFSSEIWNGKELEELRNDFLNNKRNENCSSCWSEESSGRESKRIRELKRFNHHLNKKDNPELVYLDLKLTNTCNLQCRICNGYSSSKWLEEQLYYDELDNIPNGYNVYPKKDWIERCDSFFDYLNNNLDKIEHLDFTGGEPLLINKHYDLLETLLQYHLSQSITIHYNTNLTICQVDKLNNLYPNFKHVDFQFSLDGVGKHQEFLRYPSKWDTVIENLDLYFKYKRENYHYSICYTVNSMNVFYIPEFIEWNKNTYNMDIYFNFLHRPKYYCIQQLNNKTKNIVENKLTGHGLDDIIQFMYLNEGYEDNKWLLEMIDRKDEYRKQSFSEIFNEYSKILKL